MLAREALADSDRGLRAGSLDRSDARRAFRFDQGRRYEQANQTLWEAYDLAKDGK